MGSKPSRVIVTRPAQEAAHWVEELANSGFRAYALPLIEISAVTDAADTALLQAAWRNLDDYAACMFVSGNAVQYFFQDKKRAATHENIALQAINNIASEGLKCLPAKLRFLAPGPGTAAALRAAGVPAAQVDSPPLEAGQFDSEALWQVIGQRDWHGKRVLVVCGKTSGAAPQAGAGRDWLAQKFAASGAQVNSLSVYQRSAPKLNDSQLELVQTASHDGSAWLFSSSEALANLTLATLTPARLTHQPRLPGREGAPRIDWQQSFAVATHPRIAQALRAAGWGVVRESRPTLADIVVALRSIESGTHD